MTDREREHIAKLALSIIRDAWCDRESEDPPWFNCDICELQMDDGRCGLKTFINNEHYPMEYPQGAIVDESLGERKEESEVEE